MRKTAYTAVIAILPTGLAAACSSGAPEEDPGTSAEEVVTAGATLLVAGDFASNSSTKGIAQTEIAANASTKLLAVGDLSYASPYASNC
jgi:hypothetical protein